jgi:hypothetical protein
MSKNFKFYYNVTTITALYIKVNVHIWSYLAHFFLEWEMLSRPGGNSVPTEPGQRPVTTWVHKPEAANTVWSSCWWAVCRWKYVEPSINFGMINSITRLPLVGYFYWFILRCIYPWILHFKTSVSNYHYSLRNNPEERSSRPMCLSYFKQNRIC